MSFFNITPRSGMYKSYRQMELGYDSESARIDVNGNVRIGNGYTLKNGMFDTVDVHIGSLDLTATLDTIKTKYANLREEITEIRDMINEIKTTIEMMPIPGNPYVKQLEEHFHDEDEEDEEEENLHETISDCIDFLNG